ncbi:MAG: efflux RND transporter periplasmic adaptor subunit [Chitinophagaceae bacterium]|nr:MAG: efflux RND transporter periplasmic adaptor subunit [Chitinophagaceae bacterium]
MKKLALLPGLCVLLCWTACSSVKEEKEETAKYAVTTPLKMDTSFVKEYVSQIRSVRNIEIRAQEKGYLQSSFVDEGQAVHAGQLLFRIMPKVYEAEFLKAKAEADAAVIEYQNTKTLADKKIVSPNELSLAKAKLDGARAEMALAKLHLSFTEIRAPFDGTIDRIPLKLGSLVDEGQLLTSLSDNSQVFAYFNVSEPEYLDYKSNTQNRGSARVNLLLANNEALKYAGQVETIESEFDNETGNIAFRARFPNPERLLRNGETGKVRMTVPLRGALLIPQKATYEIQDKTFVYVVDAGGIVHARNITLAGNMPDLYVVSSGLSEGDKILLEGVQKVKEDNKIEADYIEPRKVINDLRLKAE